MDLEFITSFPPVTRAYLLVSFTTNALCFARIINGITLLVNFHLIIHHFNFWRLFSHLFYFGETGIKSIFYIFFFSRYSKALEGFSFQGRGLEYLYFLITGNSLLLLMKLFVREATFLGPGITFMVVYIWGKKNAQQQINLVNLIHIKGSSLPLILMTSSWFLRQKSLKSDMMGVIAGHLYFYLEEIYPRLNGGQKILPNEQNLRKLIIF
jgi:Derlin-2/3|mmetsp:Transcript_67349/g.98534  ORF Transcript_67349/g.98534 Transcript_67349/m.98534 type:complete len:210 (+) Transcript_67349:140-769(+)